MQLGYEFILKRVQRSQSFVSLSSSLQMLKHGRAGVPMEVMGLMLGEFVDDYTVRVIDVFAMPQSCLYHLPL